MHAAKNWNFRPICYSCAMKWLPLLCILFALPALADDAKPMPLRQQPSNVQIINGKRFYSLSNVRRFTGGTNNPKALSVMHHPRTVSTMNTRSTIPFTGAPAPGSQPGQQPMPQTTSDKVLSIVAPDEKPATAATPPAIPPVPR